MVILLVTFIIYFFLFGFTFAIIRFKFRSDLIFEQLVICSAFSFLVWNFYIDDVLFNLFGTRNTEVWASASLVLAIATVSLIIYSNILLNLDRSISVYVLFWIQKRLISFDSSNKLVILHVLERFKLENEVERRIYENATRKLVKLEPSLEITFFGKFFLKFLNLVSKVFNLQNWNRTF